MPTMAEVRRKVIANSQKEKVPEALPLFAEALPVQWQAIYTQGAIERYACQSDCGLYRLNHEDSADGAPFHLWYRNDALWRNGTAISLGVNLPSKEDATRIANDHKRTQGKSLHGQG